MLHCFLVSNMYPTASYPGYGSFVKNVCDGLESYGIRTKYKAVIRGRAKNKAGKLFKYLRFYLDIVICYFRTYDFIYVHFPNQAVPVLSLLALLRKRKTIVNFHGEDLLYEPQGISGKLGHLMERYCRKYVDAIIVPSSYYRDLAAQRHLVAPDKLIISPSGGVNPEIFYPAVSKPTDKLELGYVGRLEPDKGVWEALYCCERVKDRWPIRLTIIGYGSCYDNLVDYIERHRLEDVVRIIPGVPQKELGRYYRGMHLFLFSSSSRTGESLGLTGIEAMACGVAVIGSNKGGIATYVRDRENGYLVPPADVDAMMRCIEQYQDLSSGDKQRMGEYCIETARKYLTPQVMLTLSRDLKAIVREP